MCIESVLRCQRVAALVLAWACLGHPAFPAGHLAPIQLATWLSTCPRTHSLGNFRQIWANLESRQALANQCQRKCPDINCPAANSPFYGGQCRTIQEIEKIMTSCQPWPMELKNTGQTSSLGGNWLIAFEEKFVWIFSRRSSKATLEWGAGCQPAL